MKEAYGISYFQTWTDVWFGIPFWKCVLGERISEDSCEVCKIGTYSLFDESTECKDCLWNTECLGGSIV